MSYTDIFSQNAGNRIKRVISACPKTSAVGVVGIIAIICLICFCCSVSSSFVAMYYKKDALCKCQGEVSLDEVAESFRNTTPCNYNSQNDIIYDYNVYRGPNQDY